MKCVCVCVCVRRVENSLYFKGGLYNSIAISKSTLAKAFFKFAINNK